MTWYPPICGKRKQEVKEKTVKRTEDEKVLRELVPKKF